MNEQIHHAGILTNFNRLIVISIHHRMITSTASFMSSCATSSDIILYDIISSYMDVRSSCFMFTVNTWGIRMDFPAIISAFNQALQYYPIINHAHK